MQLFPRKKKAKKKKVLGSAPPCLYSPDCQSVLEVKTEILDTQVINFALAGPALKQDLLKTEAWLEKKTFQQ